MDKDVIKHYVDSLYAVDPVYEQIREAIDQHEMPQISIGLGFGRLLTMLVNLSGAKTVLEIGALGGYSGVCLARGLGPEGKIISLELEQKHADVAQKNVTEAGFGDRIEYRIGEALDSLAQLEKEGHHFDFFFIDADKENYPNYLDWAIRLANPNALIVGDNAFLRGKIADPNNEMNHVLNMRQFNQRIAQDPCLEGVILPAYDGVCLARVKK